MDEKFLLTETAESGGSCVVRVITSAYGTGADWENDFFEQTAARAAGGTRTSTTGGGCPGG